MFIHIGLAKNKSKKSKNETKELESGFTTMKIVSLRLNHIQNAKHLQNRIRFQIGILFIYFFQEEEIRS